MKSVKMFGKSIPIIGILLIAVLAIGGVSAAVVSYLSNTITKPVSVESPIQLSGEITYFSAEQTYQLVQLNEATAQWTTADKHSGSYSVLLTSAAGEHAAVGIQYNGKIETITALSFWFKYTRSYTESGHVLGPDVMLLLQSGTTYYMAGRGGAVGDTTWKEAEATEGTNFAATSMWWYGTWDGVHPETFVSANFYDTFVALKNALPGADVLGVAVNLNPPAGSGGAYIDDVKINDVTHDLEPVIVTETFDTEQFTPQLYGGSMFSMSFSAKNLANSGIETTLGIAMTCPTVWTQTTPLPDEIMRIQSYQFTGYSGDYFVVAYDVGGIGPGQTAVKDIQVRLSPIAETGTYTIRAVAMWTQDFQAASAQADYIVSALVP